MLFCCFNFNYVVISRALNSYNVALRCMLDPGFFVDSYHVPQRKSSSSVLMSNITNIAAANSPGHHSGFNCLSGPKKDGIAMYNVLYVNDDQSQHVLLEELLKSSCDFLTPIYALNDRDAIHIMDQVEISLLMADFAIPGNLDGWALIEYLEKKNNGTKSVFITDTNDIEIVKQLKTRVDHILFKPIDGKELVQVVTTLVQQIDTRDKWYGFPIVSSLQHIAKGKKTCLLEVKTPDNVRGLIYFNEGILYDSIYRDLRGEEAVCRLIGSNSTQLRLLKSPNTKIGRRIKSELLSVILKGIQLKGGAPPNLQKNSTDYKKIDESEVPPDQSLTIVPQQSQGEDHTVELENNNQAGESFSQTQQKETDIMALEKNIESLRGINGYKAAALMNFTGEILAADSVDGQVDLANVGAVFNDIFRAAHEAAGSVGLDVCNELTIKTPNGLIIMTCSGIGAPVHFHLIAVLDKDGNQALAKMKLDKLIPIIMEELS